MSGGQVAALIFAILLLLPGGCFLLFGIGFATDEKYWDGGVVLLLIAAGILSLAGLLFWVALRRRRLAQGGPPEPPQPAA